MPFAVVDGVRLHCEVIGAFVSALTTWRELFPAGADSARVWWARNSFEQTAQ